MPKKLADLAVVTRKFVDANGNEKSVWENVGALFVDDKGEQYVMLKAYFNPAAIERRQGADSIFIPCLRPKLKNSSNSDFSNENVPF